MPKKVSLIAAVIVAFGLVFTSIAHACSGLTSLYLAMQQSATAPCGEAKPDTCKSVRDSMLSVNRPSQQA